MEPSKWEATWLHSYYLHDGDKKELTAQCPVSTIVLCEHWKSESPRKSETGKSLQHRESWCSFRCQAWESGGVSTEENTLGKIQEAGVWAARWRSRNTGKGRSHQNLHGESSRHLEDSGRSCEIYGWLQLFALLFMAKGWSLFGYKENIVVYQVNSQNWDSAGESRWAWKVDTESSRESPVLILGTTHRFV